MLRSMRIIDRLGLLFAGFFLGCGVAETTDTAAFVDSPTMIDQQAALAIHMVDVGQGDGMIIKTPSGLTIALDGGPDRSGSYADYLKRLNVTRVDYVILSHGHSDHYTGLGTAIGLLPKDCEARADAQKGPRCKGGGDPIREFSRTVPLPVLPRIAKWA